MKQVELRIDHYDNRGILNYTWQQARQVGVVGGDPLVRRPDGMLEVILDHSRLRDSQDHKNPLDDL